MRTGLHPPQSHSRLEHTRNHAGDQAASTDSTTDGFLSLLGLDVHVASVHPLSCPTPGQTHGMKQRTETSPSRHKDLVHPSPHPTFQQRGCGANSTRLMLLHTVCDIIPRGDRNRTHGAHESKQLPQPQQQNTPATPHPVRQAPDTNHQSHS